MPVEKAHILVRCVNKPTEEEPTVAVLTNPEFHPTLAATLRELIRVIEKMEQLQQNHTLIPTSRSKEPPPKCLPNRGPNSDTEGIDEQDVGTVSEKAVYDRKCPNPDGRMCQSLPIVGKVLTNGSKVPLMAAHEHIIKQRTKTLAQK